jgi:hypothetical protein
MSGAGGANNRRFENSRGHRGGGSVLWEPYCSRYSRTLFAARDSEPSEARLQARPGSVNSCIVGFMYRTCKPQLLIAHPCDARSLRMRRCGRRWSAPGPHLVERQQRDRRVQQGIGEIAIRVGRVGGRRGLSGPPCADPSVNFSPLGRGAPRGNQLSPNPVPQTASSRPSPS